MEPESIKVVAREWKKGNGVFLLTGEVSGWKNEKVLEIYVVTVAKQHECAFL